MKRRPAVRVVISTQARRHPRVHAVSYEDLMESRKPEVVRGLFEFIGLPDFWPDFSGQALKAKRPRCHLCASPASFVRCDGVPVGVGVLAGGSTPSTRGEFPRR